MQSWRVGLGAGAVCAGMFLGAAAFGLDLDGDGVSDVYLDHYNIAPIGIDTDLDDDGYTTGAESQFGTDPTDSVSRPDLELARDEVGLELRWSTMNGIVYQLQSSDDLHTWADDGSFVLGDGQSTTTSRTEASTRRFYRLEASHGPDEDGDGLDLFEELLLGTDPENPDTDNDGIADGDEFSTKTDPTNADSDGDGTSDGDELANNTNPNDDGDGLTRNPESLERKTRLAYMGVWPNYPYYPPSLPTIRLSFIDMDTGEEVAYIDENGAFTGNATPRGFYSGYSSRAQPDPILEPGNDYTMQLTFAGNSLWGNVYGRFFSTNLNPSGPPLHAIVYSTRINGGSYYYSNPTGGVWHESVWQPTGAPSNTVANAINFPIVAEAGSATSLVPGMMAAAAPASTATVHLPEVDLDVDSDNNDGIGAPDRSRTEDGLEDTQAKMIQVNDDSDNDDAIADNTQLTVANENDLVPLILKVGSKRIDWTKVSLKFSFPQSEVRLWRITKQEDTKDAALEIQPDTEYPAADLGLGRRKRELKLFMEGMAVSTDNRPITATFLFDGKDFGAMDSVLVQVVKHRIVPAASVKNTNGGLIPSRRGVRGAFHFVSPKEDGQFLEFEVLTGEPWSSGAYTLDVVNTDADTQIAGNTVRLSRKEPKKYVIQLKRAGDKFLLAEQYVWIIWATPQNVVEYSVIPSAEKTANGKVYISAKSKERIFQFEIFPAELFASAGLRTPETPDLVARNISAPNQSSPFADSPILIYGANTRVDVTQKVAIRHRNPAPTSIVFADLYIPRQITMTTGTPSNFPSADLLISDFPPEEDIGNDDYCVGDEDNDPYETARKLVRTAPGLGFVASGDWPTGPAILKTSGQPGEETAEYLKFRTFVRLNTGLVLSKSAWVAISDPTEWMVIQRFKSGRRGMEDNGSSYQANHTGF